MGPSRVDPTREVGVFNSDFIATLPAQRTAEMKKFHWILGEWNYENAVPATTESPAYSDIGTARYTLSDDGAWLCHAGPDGRPIQDITYDPFSRQWMYVLLRGSYGLLRSTDGWQNNRISFAGSMTMIGINCEWRMTWTRMNDNQFHFVNEERDHDGSWIYIDEWRFTRKS